MVKKKHLTLITLIFLSICMGFVEVLLNARGDVVSDSTQTLWGGIFLILTIIWATADAEKSNFYKPHDFGFLMYIFWPIAMPYYLISTRGLEGVVVYVGFWGICLGPWLAGLVAYTYFYTV